MPNYIDPMVANEAQHDIAAKTLLNGVVLPAGQNASKDLDDALDNIFNHPNVGPFICKQLIQHLVTSNPSPAYVARVAAVFNGNGRGPRRSARRWSAPSCSTRGARRRQDRPELRPPAASGAVHRQPAAGVRRPSRDGTATSDGYLNPQASAWAWTCSGRHRSSATSRPATACPAAPACAGPSSGCFRHRRRCARAQLRQHDGVLGIAVERQRAERDLARLDAAAGRWPATRRQLVDALNRLLLHGTMSTEMRDSVISAVNAVPRPTR